MFRFLGSKRFWKRSAIVCCLIVALLLIANGIMSWRTEARLQAKLAAIRAAGDPASIAEMAPEPIPDDQNAAAILARIAPRMREFSKDHGALHTGPDGASYAEVETQRTPPTADEIETVRQMLEQYPDIDRAIAEAAACERYASRADFSLGPQQFIEAAINGVQDIRSVGRFVLWKMRILIADKEPDGAVRSGIELLKVARLYESEPALVNYLVSIAVRGVAVEALYDALASGPVSADVHAALDEELARHDNPQRLARVLRDERAISASFAASWERLVPAESGPHRFVMRVLGWPIKSLYIGPLDAWDDWLAVADRPWHEVHDRFEPDSTGHGVLADLLMSTVQATFQANAIDLAKLRGLRIFNALTRYREEHGREASGLEELALPNEATIDPFSGEPLKLKHTEEGWIIYSVMNNGVDDGGDFTDMKDWGLAPPGWRRGP